MNAALIIATGKTPNKSNFKPQKEVGTIPAIQRIAQIFKLSGIERIVVVCDDSKEKVEKIASDMGLIFLNGDCDADMFDNVKTGLEYLQDKCESLLVSHVDAPLFSVNTVKKLVATNANVCVPTHKGRTGHPMLLKSKFFTKILEYTGENGLNGAVKATGIQRSLLEVDDEGILANIQNEESYLHLIQCHDLSQLRPDFRFRLAKEKVFYDQGAHHLLHLVTETGSLLEACRKMGISYSKGRNIISEIERQMGFSVLASQQGGATGGKSFVTDKGKEMMESYDKFNTEAKDCLDKLFDKHFKQ